MTKLKQIYKCNVCGNIVEVIHEGIGELVCCNQPMQLQEEKEKEEGQEKHLPVLEEGKIKVGSVEHPMEENHYIEWIELIIDGKSCRKFLKPGEKPEAFFGEIKGEKVEARQYCNVHGLWKSLLS